MSDIEKIQALARELKATADAVGAPVEVLAASLIVALAESAGFEKTAIRRDATPDREATATAYAIGKSLGSGDIGEVEALSALKDVPRNRKTESAFMAGQRDGAASNQPNRIGFTKTSGRN